MLQEGISIPDVISFSAPILATVIGGVIVLHIRNKYRAKWLRRALYAEVSTAHPPDFVFEGSEGIPSSVYESNTNSIGLLTSGEIPKLVEYYTLLEVNKNRIEEIRNDREIADMFVNRQQSLEDELEKHLDSSLVEEFSDETENQDSE